MGENGIPVKVGKLRSEMDQIEKRFDEFKKDNSDEHKEIKKSVSKVLGVGITILTVLVAALIEKVLNH